MSSNKEKKDDRILFSIVVPVYNTNKELITRCLKSIIEQTYANFECIVVDDGSAREYTKCLEEMGKLDHRIRLIYLEHHGNSYARNYGVSIAVGSYLMFVDSDDVIYPNVLDEARRLIVNKNPDMVMGLVKTFNEKDNVLYTDSGGNRKTQYISVCGRDQVGEVFEHIVGYRSKKYVFDDGYISGGPVARVIRMEIARKSPFPGGDLLTEDVIWNCVMMSYVENAIITTNVWYGYVHYNGSKSRKYYSNGQEVFSQQVRAYCESITKHWPGREKGLYTKLWQEIAMYFRIYLDTAPLPWKYRYKSYVKIFKKSEYIKMLKCIDFQYEQNKGKRVIKEITLYLLRHKMYLPTWFIWKKVSRKSL